MTVCEKSQAGIEYTHSVLGITDRTVNYGKASGGSLTRKVWYGVFMSSLANEIITRSGLDNSVVGRVSGCSPRQVVS